MDRLLLRPSECADEIGCSRAKVYELLASREIPAVRLGGRLRIPRHKLVEWIERKLQERVSAER